MAVTPPGMNGTLLADLQPALEAHFAHKPCPEPASAWPIERRMVASGTEAGDFILMNGAWREVAQLSTTDSSYNVGLIKFVDGLEILCSCLRGLPGGEMLRGDGFVWIRRAPRKKGLTVHADRFAHRG